MSLFDECFNTFPDTTGKPADFDDFWNRQLEQLKKIPLETEAHKKISKRMLTENNFSISFQSAGKVKLSGHFMGPKKLIGRPPVVIVFPDYNTMPVAYKGLLNCGFAQFILKLRGHEQFQLLAEAEKSNTKTSRAKAEAEESSPGLFGENLLDPERYYMTQLLLDAYRTVEVLRLRKEINSSQIGIWGIGTGVPMALFVSRFMKRTVCLFLENPSFANLELTQNLSQAAYAKEINNATRMYKKQKSQVKKNLAYCDAIYHANELNIPSAMTVNLSNRLAIPQGGFSIFHLLEGEKEMHLFLEDDPAALLKEQKKIRLTAVRFFEKTLLQKRDSDLSELKDKDEGTLNF